MICIILIIIILLILIKREPFINYRNLEIINNNKVECPLSIYYKNNDPLFIINHKTNEKYKYEELFKLLKIYKCDINHIEKIHVSNKKDYNELTDYLKTCNRKNAILKYNLLRCKLLKDNSNFCQKLNKKKMISIDNCLSNQFVKEFPKILKKDEYGIN